jgi:RsiW-degrading membrane proteinase PrsW (M82 family)
LILFLITIAPSFFIVFYLINSDRFPEPKEQIIKTFLWGIAIIFPAAIANDLLITNWNALNIKTSISHSFLSAAPVEEGLKFLILTSIIAKFRDYDDAVDGIVYCVCLSQGFAALENIYYVFSLYGASFEVAFLRAFSAVPAHAMFGAIMGIFYSQHLLAKKKDDKKMFLILSFLIPFLLHGFYNYFMHSIPLLGFTLVFVGIYFSYTVFVKWNGKKRFKI